MSSKPLTPARSRQGYRRFISQGPQCGTCAHYDGRRQRLLCTLGSFVTPDCGTCLKHKTLRGRKQEK